MSDQIFLGRGTERKGPFTRAQVSSMAQRGDIGDQDLAWHEGLSGWQPAASVLSKLGISTARPTPPSPPPPPRPAPAATPRRPMADVNLAYSLGKSIRWLLGNLRAVLGLGFLAFIGYSMITDKPSNRGLPSNTASAPAAAFTQPAQSLPMHGTGTKIFTAGAAPLEIRTALDGFHHVVRIMRLPQRTLAAEYFVRSGTPLTVEVPLGTYELRYASGKTWYGWQYLFGPDTSYSKADTPFTFSDDGYQVSGYTVELIMQSGGNLSTSGLSPAQW